MEFVQTNKSTNVRSDAKLEHLRNLVAWIDWISPEAAARAVEPVFMTPRRHPRPQTEVELLGRAQRTLLWSEGRRIPVYTWGSGPAVLFLHGWEGRGSQVESFVGPLLQRGFRVIAFDQPGHGDAPNARMTIVDFARTLLGLLDQIGDVHAVFGHSVGGAALTFARGQRVFGRRFATIAAPLRPREFVVEFGRSFGLSDAGVGALQARLGARYGLAFDQLDNRHQAPRIDAPVLVVHDRGDREVPFAHAEALAAAWPGARLMATEGLGHRRILRDPAVVNAVVEMLSADRSAPTGMEQLLSRELFERDARGALVPGGA